MNGNNITKKGIKKRVPATKRGRGFKSHPVHFFVLYNYGIG
jgi:hypothetical protein